MLIRFQLGKAWKKNQQKLLSLETYEKKKSGKTLKTVRKELEIVIL